jgi:hypothetical protein
MDSGEVELGGVDWIMKVVKSWLVSECDWDTGIVR